VKHRLTDTTVRKLEARTNKKGERINTLYFDNTVSGLALRVTPNGARSFVLNYTTKAGRNRRLTIGDINTWSAAGARERAKELKREIDTGGDPLKKVEQDRAAPTVNDLVQRYATEWLPKKRERSRIEDERIFHFITDALGHEKVADVTEDMARALHRKVTKENGPYRANRVLALLSTMMTLAKRRGSDNPCIGIERNKEIKRTRYLTEEELGRLMVALDKERDKQGADIIRMLLLTGARTAEVLKMEWAQLDLEGKVWTKPHTLTKTAENHRVPLSDEAVALLRELRSAAPDKAKLVFGLFQPRKSVCHVWSRLRVEAKIEDVRIHDLRHSYASFLVSSGVSLPVIGALLGHKTPSTTARYAHVADDAMRKATNVIKLRRAR
jgi:integrase